MPDDTARAKETTAEAQTSAAAPAPKKAGPTPEQIALRRQFPTAQDLRKLARKRLPNFAFEYADGGAGADTGIQRNWNNLDAIEIVPRYGRVVAPPPCDATILGRRYSAPIGISPVGSPGTAFPGAERYMAEAAQAANVPYTLGVLSGLTIEDAAKIAPDVLWLQLYRFSNDDHKIGLDLVRRADAAGVNVLVLTVDTPTRTVRPREVKSGIGNPFKLTMKLRLDAMRSPHWMRSLARNGIPKFVSLAPYMKPNPSIEEAAAFIRRESGGAFTWEEIARYRDMWKKPLVIKGVLHPADAERAVELGLDGIFVTSHGGRQIDALPAPIDALPAVVEAVGGRASILLDSGVRSGVDAARAVALGAEAGFAGKAFLWSLGALGDRGPAHMIDILTEDVRATLGQLGCLKVDDLHDIVVRHRTAFARADFG